MKIVLLIMMFLVLIKTLRKPNKMKFKYCKNCAKMQQINNNGKCSICKNQVVIPPKKNKKK